MNPFKALLQNAQEQNLGLGKAHQNRLTAHLENADAPEPTDRKLCQDLIHAINHTTGMFLHPNHLLWKEKALEANP